MVLLLVIVALWFCRLLQRDVLHLQAQVAYLEAGVPPPWCAEWTVLED